MQNNTEANKNLLDKNPEINSHLSGNSPEADEKNSKFVEIIKKAADATHTFLFARQKSKKALDAAETNDKMLMWSVLQEYIAEYASFINRLSAFTAIHAYNVPDGYYDSVTADEIARQLKTMVLFVYIKELVDSGAKSALKSLVKKMVLKSGIFTEEELKQIL